MPCTKLCRHKMNTVCNCSHDARFDVGFEFVWVFSYLNFTLITVDNIYHCQNVSSNRNETFTVTCSHSSYMIVEFRNSFKLLRLALRFHIFSCRYRVNAFSNSAGIVSTGSKFHVCDFKQTVFLSFDWKPINLHLCFFKVSLTK